MAIYKKVCKTCGKEFEAKNHRTQYCSEKCRRVGNSRTSQDIYKRKKEKAIKDAIEKGKVCPVCGKVITRSPQAKYCSKLCQWKAKQEKSQKNNTSKLSKNGTLCWHCEWSTGKEGKCPWASHLIPVKGWKAKKVKLKVSTTDYTDSYIVKACPLFEEG